MQCVQPAVCSQSFEYCVANISQGVDDTVCVCMREWPVGDETQTTHICLDDMTMYTLYRTFAPRADFTKENDMDVCGYCFSTNTLRS